MDDHDDPDSRLRSGARRSLARNSRCLHCFYSTASAQDAHLLDLLVSYRESYVSTIWQPRDFAPPDLRIAYEKMCNAIEVSYMCLRNGVYQTETFRRLQPAERRKIEATLDDLY